MSFRQRHGMQKPPESEPERVTPVPEHYKGVNFPYRGTNKHGVEVPEGAEYDTREFQYEMPDPDEITDEYMEPDDEPEPIPVRLVQESAREVLKLRTVRRNVTDQRSQIVNRMDSRRNLVIKVDGGVSAIYVGDADVTTYTGFKLDQGEQITFRSTDDVWAVCADGDDSEISIMYEFAVEL